MKDQKSPSPKRWRRVLRGFFYTLFILFVILVTCSMATIGVAAGFVASLVKDEPVRDKDSLEKRITNWSQTSEAFFRDGTPIGKLRADEDRKVVQAKEVSPHLIDALIAIEDREFYEHKGIVPRSLMRAVLQTVTKNSVQTGGSTITQQLVKNTILEDRTQSYDRKAKEVFIALRMERFFDKDEIMTAYLNSLYFGKAAHGRNMLGVQAAARGMFGVDAKDLNIPQAAYIAGMVQRPNDYNPFRGEKNLERGKKRMKLVLDKMLEYGKINEKEYKEALAYDIEGALVRERGQMAQEKYPFINMELEERAAKILMELDGHDPAELSKQGKYRVTLEEYKKQVLTGGYKIYTTIDQKLYDSMNKAATNKNRFRPPHNLRLANGKVIKNAQEEVGATLIDVKTGALLAFVGGRDFSKNQKNHALDSRRQPGSTIKPLLDFGPALDRGVMSPESIIIDEELRSGNHVYRNYTGSYAGPITARRALALSYNIPAIKALRAVGVQNGLDYLRKMEFPVHENDGEASAIGGFTYGFTVEQMTSGFATLANEGKFNEPYMIEKIVDSEGNVVYEHEPNPVQVYSPQAAYWTTDMLRDVIRSGTGQRLISPVTAGYDAAGKTGTTNNAYDVWFIGYTPEIALGVWVGYDYNHRINDQLARLIWGDIFRAINKADPELSPKGSRFKPQPPLPHKCFECNRQVEKKEGENNNENGNQNNEGRNNQGGNRRNQQPVHPPRNDNGNGNGNNPPPVTTPVEPPDTGTEG